MSARRASSARSVPLAVSRSPTRDSTAATAAASGSDRPNPTCTRVVTVAQAAPAKKQPTSAAGDSGVTSPEASAV